MELILNINDQQFYRAEVPDLVDYSSVNKCAVIIDEDNLQELLSTDIKFTVNNISQVIIISDSLNTFLPDFIGKEVFLISAIETKQAIEIAFLSKDLNKNVVCVLNLEMDELKKIIASVVV